ncbi:unnamed protein product [Paramecium sonneborni]|uniref:Uncharacterized protein n=1 Tax=Paramecium sonneborni TaxID=65129 RepID=A0A8S1LKZ7_9CILI|nr:unnamed protein product [Paramecium sonneborni]
MKMNKQVIKYRGRIKKIIGVLRKNALNKQWLDL